MVLSPAFFSPFLLSDVRLPIPLIAMMAPVTTHEPSSACQSSSLSCTPDWKYNSCSNLHRWGPVVCPHEHKLHRHLSQLARSSSTTTQRFSCWKPSLSSGLPLLFHQTGHTTSHWFSFVSVQIYLPSLYQQCSSTIVLKFSRLEQRLEGRSWPLGGRHQGCC